MILAETPGVQRLDQWLCYARFFKTRSLAAKIVKSKGVRVDGDLKTKSSATIKPGQTLTFMAGERMRIVRILALAERRGPASEAALLYEDLSPPMEKRETRPRGGGRPTKKDRRALDAFKGEDNA